jgi:hypothetical protein
MAWLCGQDEDWEGAHYHIMAAAMHTDAANSGGTFLGSWEAAHITAEDEQLRPVAGKEMKRVWFVKNRNNHWLDATALACAAAGAVGVRLVPSTVEPVPVPQSQRKFKDPYGRPFVASFR